MKINGEKILSLAGLVVGAVVTTLLSNKMMENAVKQEVEKQMDSKVEIEL